ncbi:MAG: DUF1579 domain-containing protein [Acidobacteriia bacterium]|nr:DUF1579 domain-containing protein [Terriglobia bacterium]
MSKAIRAVVALASISVGLAFAQTPGGPPKPGPEHKRLGYFVGTWRSEAEVKPNAFMPAGKMTSDDTCAWFEGGFAVVCNSSGTSPMGPTKELGILGYSTEEKVYTYLAVENSPMAMTSVPRGHVNGGSWVYEDESKMGGKLVKSRYVMNETSPTAYAFKWEMLGENGAWQTIVEGTSTKK